MKRLFLLFLLLVTSATFAAEQYARPRFYTQQLPSTYFDTQEAACSASAARAVQTVGTLLSAVVSYAGGGPNALGTCHVKYTPFAQTGTGVTSNAVSVQQSCPAGYLLGPSTTNIYQRLCTISVCPTGTTLNTATNKCDDNCLPYKGQLGSFGLNCSSETSGGQPVCMPNNCAANVIDTASVRLGNCWFGTNTARYTGETCNGQRSASSLSNPSNANPPPADLPETDCIKQGKSFGTVNGVVVCVPKGSASAAPITQTNQNTTTTTNTDAAGNSTTGTSTETKNATQDGDQVTSQIIKTNADGSKTEETKTESTFSFCATNPTHPICKKPASEDEEGDTSCEDNPDLPKCMKVGQAEEGDNLTTDARTISFSPVTITSGGSCPADKSISIAGKSITFSYTWLCNYASMFKPFMLAFAYLSAAMFLFMGLRGANT